jgi:ankyrin repeat protein
MDGFLLAV